MTEADVAAKNAQSHLNAVELFPDDPIAAGESLACFIANCLLSIKLDPETFYNRVDDFLAFYVARDKALGQ